jgi:hypothetical protein
VTVIVTRPRGGGQQPASPPSVRPSDGAPTGVRLRDEGTSITVSWRDPSDGKAPFIVAVGHPGEQVRPYSQVPPGQTSVTVYGLNPGLDYCVTVAAVYSTETFPISDLVCTQRLNPQPSHS